jgi:hypothetical protein
MSYSCVRSTTLLRVVGFGLLYLDPFRISSLSHWLSFVHGYMASFRSLRFHISLAHLESPIGDLSHIKYRRVYIRILYLTHRRGKDQQMKMGVESETHQFFHRSPE